METNQHMAGPFDLTAPVTKMLAIGSWTEKGRDKAARFPLMVEEVPATVKLYLTGAIEQWYVKPDISGVVFIMNVTSADAAHQLLEKLPLGIAGMMAFDFIELGPITPLRFLLPLDK
ncbi:hypothetical protein [Mucilaginibacter pocheonensis]|uniref:Muconolactone delta-isomerase n=1 Tax=Mucilaginibacter pocheonensis TaxID=398050 RepID=A0ABU1TFM2_9SPHI|nr:hypothetical protein [Mucilaginibacter pocheonensis]MDR6944123.1 hypothetical protein [Mucilaginibacter pocheonensis]